MSDRLAVQNTEYSNIQSLFQLTLVMRSHRSVKSQFFTFCFVKFVAVYILGRICDFSHKKLTLGCDMLNSKGNKSAVIT